MSYAIVGFKRKRKVWTIDFGVVDSSFSMLYFFKNSISIGSFIMNLFMPTSERLIS